MLNCGLFMAKDYPPFIHIALYQPEIHPNTGNVARLCAANALPLHLVGNLGFRIDDRSVRRAGLDYWPFVNLHREKDLNELEAKLAESRLLFFSARAERIYTDMEYKIGDCLVFGPESRGLPPELLHKNWNHALKIPMVSSNVRSLNLATAVGIAAYEALRQTMMLCPERTPWKKSRNGHGPALR